MTLTLYCNSQTEAENEEGLYSNRWALSPYESPSMFCAGETHSQADFVLPLDFTVKDGKILFNKLACELKTDEGGRPYLCSSGAGFVPETALFRPNESPPRPARIVRENAKTEGAEKPAAAPRGGPWVPAMDSNGEWEIF